MAAWLAVAVVLAGLAAYLIAEKTWMVKPAPLSKPTTSVDTPMAFNLPPHSIAVLPFVNLSGDKDQEYFSDGLTEELLNSLSRINELQVTGRTSSFYFKGEHVDLSTIAHKLNVATVLEGSVRRSTHTVRVTAQLINAVTGFHLWSQTYDRDFGDILKIQTEIANAVASALRVNLLGDVTAKIAFGGTRSSAAFDAYLRALTVYFNTQHAQDVQTAIAGFTDALRLDPKYALAYAGRSMAHRYFADLFATTEREAHASVERALDDAHRAIELAPELAEGHLALAVIHQMQMDFVPASQEYERALALAPGSSRVLRSYGPYAVAIGHVESGLAASRRAVALEPLSAAAHHDLGENLYLTRHYGEAIAAFSTSLTLNPANDMGKAMRGWAYYFVGDLAHAQLDCESTSDYPIALACLAVIYEKLGRHADAQASFAEYKSLVGETAACEYACVLAQWHDRHGALTYLENAARFRDPALTELRTNPCFDPLRNEPRFQALERALKFPQ